MKFLVKTSLLFWHRLEEAVAELYTIKAALIEKHVVITDAEMSRGRVAADQVVELELALKPELAADRAELRGLFEQFEKLEKELDELDDLGPPEPATSFTEDDVGIVLGALHLAVVHTTQPPDEKLEQRGPSWQDETIALWEHVLTVVDPKDPSASFELAWAALVEAAGKYLDHYAPSNWRYE